MLCRHSLVRTLPGPIVLTVPRPAQTVICLTYPQYVDAAQTKRGSHAPSCCTVRRTEPGRTPLHDQPKKRLGSKTPGNSARWPRRPRTDVQPDLALEISSGRSLLPRASLEPPPPYSCPCVWIFFRRGPDPSLPCARGDLILSVSSIACRWYASRARCGGCGPAERVKIIYHLRSAFVAANSPPECVTALRIAHRVLHPPGRYSTSFRRFCSRTCPLSFNVRY